MVDSSRRGFSGTGLIRKIFPRNCVKRLGIRTDAVLACRYVEFAVGSEVETASIMDIGRRE